MFSLARGWLLPLAIVALCGWNAQVAAQTWPSRPVKVIVPYPAGGSADLVVRAVTQKMGEALDQAFVVDYKPGAGARLGVEAAARAAADGYTMGFVTTSPLSVAPHLYTTLGYDPLKSFESVILLTQAPFIVTVGASVDARTLDELVRLDKADPGKLNYASFGPGSLLHFQGANFNARTGTKLVHVPYKGSAPALLALLSGESHVIFDQLASLRQANFQSGKLRALAVMAPKRLEQMPDVPTVAEAGFPGLEGSVWYGFVVPAGTPREIVGRLNEAAQRALTDKAVIDVLVNQNALIIEGGPPGRLDAVIRDDSARWAHIVKETGFRPD